MGASSFNEMEIDAIGEIMNISLGASATAVSTMLGTAVNITTPVVNVLTDEEFEFKSLEPAVGVEIVYTEGLEGSNIMMFRRNDVRVIVGMLMGDEVPEEEFELDEINISAICEVMNQMMGSSATALSEFLETTVNISTPVSFEIEDDNQFKKKYFAPNTSMVVVRFVLEIENKLRSEFLNIMSINLTKRLLEPFEAAFAIEQQYNEEKKRQSREEEEKAQSMQETEVRAKEQTPVQGAAQTEPSVVEEEPQSQSMAMQPQPMEPRSQSMAMQPQPMEPQSQAMAMQPQPMETQSQSMAMQPQPMEPQSQSMAMQPQSMATQPQSMAMQPQSMATQPQPMAMQPQPVPQQNYASYQMPQPPVYQMPSDPMMLQLLNQMQQTQAQMLEMMKDVKGKEKEGDKRTRESSLIRPMDPVQMEEGLITGHEEQANQEMLMKVPLEVSVEIGRTKKPVRDILEFTQGSLVVLDKMAGEQADLFVNGQCIARGDIVVVEDNFGIRITEIISRDLNAESL